MPYSLLRKVFCPIIFWQTTEHRVWGFLPSPGEASAAKAKSRKSKDSKKLPFLRRPWEDQHSSTELLCPTWSHIVPRRANSFWGQWREREREREWMSLYICSRVVDVDPSSISNWNFCHLHLFSFGPAARRKASKRTALKPRTGVTCCWRSMKNWRRGQFVWGIYWPLWSRVEHGNHPCCDLIQAFDFSRSSFALLCCWVAEVLMWQTQISNLG